MKLPTIANNVYVDGQSPVKSAARELHTNISSNFDEIYDTFGDGNTLSLANLANDVANSLALGTLAYQDASDVNVTGGGLDGVTLTNATISSGDAVLTNINATTGNITTLTGTDFTATNVNGTGS